MRLRARAPTWRNVLPVKREHQQALERIQTVLPALGVARRSCTRQTAICVYALLDTKPRNGLLAGKQVLADGARIHDVLQFARNELGIRVAENTRESYRKASLRPLNELGVITRHQLSTNDPNTFYRLSAVLVEPLRAAVAGRAGADAFAEFRRQAARRPRPEGDGPVIIQVGAGKTFELSPGEHGHLTKGFVEIFGPGFLHRPSVVYVGDTARKKGYQDRQLMRELNLPVEVKAGLPDAILFSGEDRRLVVGEAVTSTGPINSSRLEQLRPLVRGPVSLGYQVEFVTAFPSRSVLRRFVEDIAWGTAVWVAAEPNSIILFQARGGQQ